MNVVGIGIDITEVPRIAEMLEKHGELFLQRVYTQGEIDYCQPRRAADQHYAGRWAAKEAVLKAIGTGWSKGIHWTDIEVINEEGGQPIIKLHGAAREACDSNGIDEVLISISHIKPLAIAYATAVRKLA
jgi:holo-[acyl-carrier protein] synthase